MSLKEICYNTVIHNTEDSCMLATAKSDFNEYKKLEKDSDVLIANIRAIDNARFIEKLASLTNKELFTIKNLLDEVLV